MNKNKLRRGRAVYIRLKESIDDLQKYREGLSAWSLNIKWSDETLKVRNRHLKELEAKGYKS